MTATGPQAIAARLQHFGLARDQMRSVLAVSAGLPPADLDALEHLEADGPLTQRQLGDRLSLTSGAITMLVDRLEQGHWARRRPHPTDRRYVLVELTEHAVTGTPPALAAYHARIWEIAASFPQDHLQAIASFLQAAADAAAATAAQLRGRL